MQAQDPEVTRYATRSRDRKAFYPVSRLTEQSEYHEHVVSSTVHRNGVYRQEAPQRRQQDQVVDRGARLARSKARADAPLPATSTHVEELYGLRPILARERRSIHPGPRLHPEEPLLERSSSLQDPSRRKQTRYNETYNNLAGRIRRGQARKRPNHRNQVR
jgi:hypothetical protein